MSVKLDVQIPDFAINQPSFLIPANDQSNFWKSRPNSYKCVNNMTIYYKVYIINGICRIDSGLIDKINLQGEMIPFF